MHSRSIKSAHPGTSSSYRSGGDTYYGRHSVECRSSHDCRPDNLKHKTRKTLYDTAVLSQGLYRTTKSTIQLNDKYLLYQRNLIDKINNSLFRDDKILKQIESGGDGDLEYDDLKWPNAIACSVYGDICVCDSQNHRILVFNRDLVYKYTVGSKGNFNGQFDEPSDIAVSVTNQLLVADKNNSRIEIYEEHLVYKQSKTKINAFVRSQTIIQENEDGTRSAIVTNTSRSNSLQFKYKMSLVLDDKPVKVCTSLMTAILLVTTLNGSVYIFNSSYRILSSIKLKEHVDLIDMKNVCIHRNGNEFIMLKNYQNQPSLLFYQFQDTLINKIKNVSMNKADNIDSLNTIHLVRVIEIQRAYYPGVTLDRALNLRYTPDLNHLVVYDVRNLCVLIYDLNGNFLKVMFHSYDRLEQLLAMTFSPEGHFISCEYEIRQNVIKNTSKLTTARAVTSGFVRRYIFKVKIYRYLDCDCHRHRPSISKKRISQTALPRRFLSRSTNIV